MKLKSAIIHQLFSLFSRGDGGGRLTILQFHKIPRDFDPLIPGELLLDKFEKVLDFFVEHMRVLPLTDALKAMKSGCLPKNAVALTLDDGYAEWNEFVAPALLHRGLPATFYVTTEQLTGPALWHERIAAAVRAAPNQGFSLPKGFVGYSDLAVPDMRTRLLILLQERLKYMPLDDRDQAIRHLEAQAVTPLKLPKPFGPEQVRQLHSLGFEIGAHTIHHPILIKSTDMEALEEIGGAKETLESIIRGSVTSFAYPNGRVERDFSRRDVELAKACGYRSAVITGGGIVDCNTDPMQLPRFTPWGPGQGRMALQIARNLHSGGRFKRGGGTKLEKKPKILFVECGAGFGGAVIALETLLKHSTKEEMQCDVVTNLPVGKFDAFPAVRSVKVIGNRILDVRDLAKRVEASECLPARKALLFAIGRLDDFFNRIPYLLRLALHVAKVNPDIIHGNNEPSSNREAMIVAKVLNKPYVQHLRGPIADSTHTPWLLRKPDAFIPVSRWLAEELLVNGVPSGKIHQIYDAVEFEEKDFSIAPDLRDELGLAHNTIIVAMIGMLVPWKGQDLFIEAVSSLSEMHNVVFLVIGGTPELANSAYADKLQQLVIDHNLQSRIKFTGKRTDLKLVMKQFDIVVSCSTEPEPLGLVMLEGMANGCLFIGPAFGAATEVVEDGVNGLLFAPRSPDSLAEKLVQGISMVVEKSPVGSRASYGVRAKFRGVDCAAQTLDVQISLL